MTVQGGFWAQVVYKTKECLNHINTMQMPNVISKRVRSSSRDAHKRTKHSWKDNRDHIREMVIKGSKVSQGFLPKSKLAQEIDQHQSSIIHNKATLRNKYINTQSPTSKIILTTISQDIWPQLNLNRHKLSQQPSKLSALECHHQRGFHNLFFFFFFLNKKI